MDDWSDEDEEGADEEETGAVSAHVHAYMAICACVYGDGCLHEGLSVEEEAGAVGACVLRGL